MYGRLLFPNLLPSKNKLGEEIQESADSTLGAPCGSIRITDESPCPLHNVYLAKNTSLHLLTGPFVPKLARFTQLRPPSVQRWQASPLCQRPELFIPRTIREEVVDCCWPDGGGEGQPTLHRGSPGRVGGWGVGESPLWQWRARNERRECTHSFIVDLLTPTRGLYGNTRLKRLAGRQSCPVGSGPIANSIKASADWNGRERRRLCDEDERLGVIGRIVEVIRRPHQSVKCLEGGKQGARGRRVS